MIGSADELPPSAEGTAQLATETVVQRVSSNSAGPLETTDPAIITEDCGSASPPAAVESMLRAVSHGGTHSSSRRRSSSAACNAAGSSCLRQERPHELQCEPGQPGDSTVLNTADSSERQQVPEGLLPSRQVGPHVEQQSGLISMTDGMNSSSSALQATSERQGAAGEGVGDDAQV